MSVMDKLKDMLKGHPEQSSKGVDKGGDYVDEKTHGKRRGQVDTAQRKAKEEFGRKQDEGPEQQ